ncbi:hypothetical protein [Leptospira mayottensis]|uniref:hypothetical protein n=1 Tax=Leptospira mayottensis TaxID=1137606 RepID=UPI0002BDB775|nr:hypothetical protein [Leptospira mayottensis]
MLEIYNQLLYFKTLNSKIDKMFGKDQIRSYSLGVFYMIKLEGFDEFQNGLKNLENNLKKLSEKKEIGFLELFPTEFMSKYTDYSSVEEMFSSSGFVINSEDDFTKLEKSPDWDAFVSQNTKFNSWEEMINFASDIYINQVLDN